MTHMLVMAARQFGHPMPFQILVITSDSLHHGDTTSHNGMIGLADSTKSLIVTLANAFSVAA
jgi:hypothetical protein